MFYSESFNVHQPDLGSFGAKTNELNIVSFALILAKGPAADC